MSLQLAALILPLSLDTLAVSAAIGLAGLSGRERLRLSLIMAGFEAGMTLVGVLAGHLLAGPAGRAAEVVAACVLAAVGVAMLREGDGDRAPADVAARARGLAVVGLGVGVSLDELGIGIAIGLLGLPVPVVTALVGAQAVVASQLGSRAGGRLGRRLSGGAGRVAGAALVAVAAALLVSHLRGGG